MTSGVQPPALQTSFFYPGMRIGVACSGGADSTALLCALFEQRNHLGLALSIAHVNHGIRGAESDADEAFVAALAATFDLPFLIHSVDTPTVAEANRQGLEETARNLRYSWFWELLSAGQIDAVVTAHTLNDQAETVLHRLLRGAWTEGLSGIHPILKQHAKQPGVILRPFLTATRQEIEAWLRATGQVWREDSSNRDLTFTRNRLRYELLPQLAGYNPGIRSQLAQLAALARDEEAYWQAELTRLLSSLVLPGKPVRGGGRATDTVTGDQSLSIEIERFRVLHPALRRRVLRAAAAQLGFSIDFEDTERLLGLCGLGSTDGDHVGHSRLKLQIENGLLAERSPRELRIYRAAVPEGSRPVLSRRDYTLPIPGVVEAPAFGLRLEASVGKPPSLPLADAHLRSSQPGDRVRLRHSRSPMKIKEALLRARIPAAVVCPVVEWQGEIVWMPRIEIESASARSVVLSITATPIESSGQECMGTLGPG